MQTVILCQGYPGSGKSTWAKLQVGDGKTVRIDNDSLRMMLNNTYWEENKKTQKITEAFMIQARDALILLALEQGKDVIVDATHLSPKHENHVKQLIGDKAEISIMSFMDVPIEQCIKNDLKRDKSVGEAVIRRMEHDYNKAHGINQPNIGKPIPYDEYLPDCIICDIDGTVANNEWRSPFDTTRCYEDGIYETIVDIARRERKQSGAFLFFVSGREAIAEGATKKWLDDYQIVYDGLFMRKTGDHRKDYVIKEEIYEQEFKGKYNVLFVLDDRNQTVEKWRELGLTCLQVAPGDF